MSLTVEASRARGRPAPPTPRIWLTAGALLAVACQGGGDRPLETSAGLSLDPWGLAEPPTPQPLERPSR